MAQPAETIASIGSVKLALRSQRLQQKASDLFSVLECILDRQYNPKGFDIGPEDTVIDIGGHIGSFSVLAGKAWHKGKVYVFEPDPSNFKQLERNVALNGLTNTKLFMMAVGPEKGRIRLYTDTKDPAASSVIKTSNTHVEAECTSLKEIFMRNKIRKCDFLKIDCEGSEYGAITKAPKSVIGRIEKIAGEYHDLSKMGAGKACPTFRELEEFLESEGFEVLYGKENLWRGLFFAQKA